MEEYQWASIKFQASLKLMEQGLSKWGLVASMKVERNLSQKSI